MTPWDPPTRAPSPTNPAVVQPKIVFRACENEWVSQGTALVKILDESSCEIYSIHPDGSGLARLTNNSVMDSDPAGSPDGNRIAYISDGDGQTDLFVMNADGSSQTRLTQSNFREAWPAWTPDGAQILYVIIRPNGVSEIRLIRADGSGETTLAQRDESDGYYESPSMSPDGSRIVFAVSGIGNGYTAIFVMDADGSNVKKLTGDGWYQGPAWSPDGARIAYEAVSDAGGGDIEIFVMDPEGGGKTNISQTPGRDFMPAWSPDGLAIAFVHEISLGEYAVFTMDAGGGGQTQVTEQDVALEPSWLAPAVQVEFVQHPDCSDGWTRLAAGDQAMVSPESDTPNRVRASPSTSASILTQIGPGSLVELLEGPVCADGLVFWKVKSAAIPGGVGWTAEGDGQDYWLVPE